MWVGVVCSGGGAGLAVGVAVGDQDKHPHPHTSADSCTTASAYLMAQLGTAAGQPGRTLPAGMRHHMACAGGAQHHTIMWLSEWWGKCVCTIMRLLALKQTPEKLLAWRESWLRWHGGRHLAAAPAARHPHAGHTGGMHAVKVPALLTACTSTGCAGACSWPASHTARCPEYSHHKSCVCAVCRAGMGGASVCRCVLVCPPPHTLLKPCRLHPPRQP